MNHWMVENNGKVTASLLQEGPNSVKGETDETDVMILIKSLASSQFDGHQNTYPWADHLQ